jgi:Xaa-Pro aminopeptidase
LKQSYAFYDRRRKELIDTLKKQNPTIKNGAVMLLAGFEDGKHTFRQESSFYYYTGLTEPGLVLIIELSGKSRLFIPAYATPRSDWLVEEVVATKECAQNLSLSEVSYLGKPQQGYEPSLLVGAEQYQDFIAYLKNLIDAGGSLFTYTAVKKNVVYPMFLMQMRTFLPTLMEHLRDISLPIAAQRSRKNKFEIELMYKAVELTMVAQEAAARVIQPGIKESIIKAGIEYIFAESEGSPAFPSIVATGKNSTILHYHNGNAAIKPNDLVVVDIGAEYEYYCADITRTYPASGTFTKRQREVYEAVLATHEYIATLAKPGMFLRNAEKPELSLHHLAVAHLEKKGFAKYFKHGIGHYLGLDVHDVGDYAQPLEEGNVITIEPGIYIPEENIGIRIEDDYWIVSDGAECLSAELPRDAESVQEMARASIDDEDEDDEEDYD